MHGFLFLMMAFKDLSDTMIHQHSCSKIKLFLCWEKQGWLLQETSLNPLWQVEKGDRKSNLWLANNRQGRLRIAIFGGWRVILQPPESCLMIGCGLGFIQGQSLTFLSSQCGQFGLFCLCQVALSGKSGSPGSHLRKNCVAKKLGKSLILRKNYVEICKKFY